MRRIQLHTRAIPPGGGGGGWGGGGVLCWGFGVWWGEVIWFCFCVFVLVCCVFVVGFCVWFFFVVLFLCFFLRFANGHFS